MDTLDSKALGIEAFDPSRHPSDTKLYTLQEDPDITGGVKLLDAQDDYAAACASPWLYVVKAVQEPDPEVEPEPQAEDAKEEEAVKPKGLLAGVRSAVGKLFNPIKESTPVAAEDDKDFVTLKDGHVIFIGGPGEGGGSASAGGGSGIVADEPRDVSLQVPAGKGAQFMVTAMSGLFDDHGMPSSSFDKIMDAGKRISFDNEGNVRLAQVDDSAIVTLVASLMSKVGTGRNPKEWDDEAGVFARQLAQSLSGVLNRKSLEDSKAGKWSVQPFHSDWGTSEGAWSFSGSDGNAILKKGDWALYKQVHLVCDTSEGDLPKVKAAYKYPVAKLVGGKPTYFFRAAAAVNAGLGGGARAADLPAAINGKVAGTVKKIYKLFERNPKQVQPGEGKKGFVTLTDGRVIVVEEPGKDGVGAVGREATLTDINLAASPAQKFAAARGAAEALGLPANVYKKTTNADQVKWRAIDLLAQSGVSETDAEESWNSAFNDGLALLIVGDPSLTGTKALDDKGFVTLDNGNVIFIGGPGEGGGSEGGAGLTTATMSPESDPSKELYVVTAGGVIIPKEQFFSDMWRYRKSPDEGFFVYSLSELRDRGMIEESLEHDEDTWMGDEQVEEFWADTEGKAFKGRGYAFKATDGSDWWMQWTTNAFRDRESEIFTTKALEDYIDRHRGEKVKGEFWYRHIHGTKFADVQWQAMVGRFLVQAGPFDSTPVGQAFKEFFSAHPDGHPVVAPQGWGTSHGYYYNAEDRKDRVYDWLEIRESTVLPAHVAANPWSPVPRIIQRSGKNMNAQEEKELEAIGGKDFVALIKQQGQDRTKTLEGAVAYKVMPDTIAQLQGVANELEGELKTTLLNAIASLEQEAAEEATAQETSVEEAKQEGAASMEETAAAEAAEEKSVEKPVEQVEEKSIPQITREEVVEAMTELGSQIKDEVVRATAESLKALLQPFADEIAALKRADGEKIAEKAMQTPAASLSELLRSVRTKEAASVGKDDPLTERKPKEVDPAANPALAGLPSLIGSFITGADRR